MATRPPRPDLALSARTVAWLADQPHQREFVRSVWDGLAELERAGYHTGPSTRCGPCSSTTSRPSVRASAAPAAASSGGAAAFPASCGSRSAARCCSRSPGAVATAWRPPGGDPPVPGHPRGGRTTQPPARPGRAAPQAGRHSRRGRLTWWRRGRGSAARSRPGPRLAGVTDAGTLIEHLMTGQATADGRGRYVAVRLARVLPASLTAPERGVLPAVRGKRPVMWMAVTALVLAGACFVGVVWRTTRWVSGTRPRPPSEREVNHG
jgi:hypothetical protein